ncbi:MAG: response regulator [Pyrinomonadaceae bacterium]
MMSDEKKIRVLVVDDEPIARRGLRLYLRDEPDVEIIGECANGRAAVAAIRERQPDLIFLDVQMPLMDGFGVVEEVGAERSPVIVFVTAYDEHALRAFEAGALDYLLKPFHQDRLKKTLARVRGYINHPNRDEYTHQLIALLQDLKSRELSKDQPKRLERVAIKESGRLFFLSVDEIDWVESEGNYVRLHTGRATHLLRETMDGMEARLSGNNFVRLRRSTLANATHIKELQPLFNSEYRIILRDGTRLTSSRRYRKNLDALLKS